MKSKKTVSLLVICALLIAVNLTWQVSAQKLSDTTRPAQEAKTKEISQKENLKKVFDEEVSKAKLKKTQPSVDFEAIEKARYKKQADDEDKGWDKKTVTIMVVFAIATTILVVLVAKYGKVPKCDEIYCPSGETCPCDE